mmetsp:Transcript_34096/g.71589  ORF Transcript_34096/g.71589 Transcript_34096/m.71589 type:complete len:202 (-) Transcript_34096:214-819(-)
MLGSGETGLVEASLSDADISANRRPETSGDVQEIAPTPNAVNDSRGIEQLNEIFVKRMRALNDWYLRENARICSPLSSNDSVCSKEKSEKGPGATKVTKRRLSNPSSQINEAYSSAWPSKENCGDSDPYEASIRSPLQPLCSSGKLPIFSFLGSWRITANAWEIWRKRVEEARRPSYRHTHVPAVAVATTADSRELLTHVE